MEKFDAESVYYEAIDCTSRRKPSVTPDLACEPCIDSMGLFTSLGKGFVKPFEKYGK